MIEQVHPADFSGWLDEVRPLGEPILLDVREPRELAMASIQPQGCSLVHIPMGTLPPRLRELDPARPVACLCHHGARSMQVAAFLEHHGFARVANIAGGINAWSDQVDPGVPRY